MDDAIGPGDGEQIRTIHEAIPGFEAVMACFEALPGVNQQWRETVVLPPFADNRTIIFERDPEAA